MMSLLLKTKKLLTRKTKEEEFMTRKCRIPQFYLLSSGKLSKGKLEGLMKFEEFLEEDCAEFEVGGECIFERFLRLCSHRNGDRETGFFRNRSIPSWIDAGLNWASDPDIPWGRIDDMWREKINNDGDN